MLRNVVLTLGVGGVFVVLNEVPELECSGISASTPPKKSWIPLLNEVLSLNAQEFFAIFTDMLYAPFLNEVLSLNAQEFF